MIRRTRRHREAPFSFDSFLDVVANVVGIIIRLILVVWVGARSYSSIQKTELLPAEALVEVAKPDDQAPDLTEKLDRQRAEMQQAQQRLLAQMRRLQDAHENSRRQPVENGELSAKLALLENEKRDAERMAQAELAKAGELRIGREEISKRSAKLLAEIHDLEKQPAAKKTLHYRTPVSRPVQSEELYFECKNGKITFIDMPALLDDLKHGIEEQGRQLRSTWQVEAFTQPVKAFRLRYVVEREKGMLDSLGGETGPTGNGGFRYGVTGWMLEPVAFMRGETLADALKPTSEFRQIVDVLDSQYSAVTFWVYPDSFEVFRRLRDYLYEKDIVVAGRPLPDGMPIASSRKGSISRGQ